MPWTMSFGYMMNRISLGSRGDSKEEEPEKAKEKVEEKEKVKEDQAADFSDLVEKEKERDEVKVIVTTSVALVSNSFLLLLVRHLLLLAWHLFLIASCYY